MTVAECARDAAAALVRAGHAPDDSRRDAAILARHILGWDAAEWLMRQRDDVPAALVGALGALVARRGRGEPVAYLIGEKEFYGRAFAVTPDVLIPRPETELVVDVALARIDRAAARELVRVVDIGAGSGCIAVTLAAERHNVQAIATDVSAAALAVASANAARHGVSPRVECRHQPFDGGAQQVDLVVTNPPYVAESDRAALMRDVRDYEPALALFGGADGLDVIRTLIPDAFAALRPGGALVMEIGVQQFEAVGRLLDAAGFASIVPHADLAGIVRVVEADRAARPV